MNRSLIRKVKRILWQFRWKQNRPHYRVVSDRLQQGERAQPLRNPPFGPRSERSTWIIGKSSLSKVVEWINSALESLNVEVVSFNTRLFIWDIHVWSKKYRTGFISKIKLYEDRDRSGDLLFYLIEISCDRGGIGSFQHLRVKFEATFKRFVVSGSEKLPETMIGLERVGFLESSLCIEEAGGHQAFLEREPQFKFWEDQVFGEFPILLHAYRFTHEIIGDPITYFRETGHSFPVLIDALDEIFQCDQVRVEDATEAIIVLSQIEYYLLKYYICQRCVDLKEILMQRKQTPKLELLDMLQRIIDAAGITDRLRGLAEVAHVELLSLFPSLVKSASQDSFKGGGGGSQ